MKFFADLYGEKGTLSDILLSDADRRLIIEIISRELSHRTVANEVNTFFSRYTHISLSCRTQLHIYPY